MFTVTYQSERWLVKAALAVPDGSGPFPALLYCRGGIRNVGRVRPERIAQLASFGYVVLAPHYRGNEGGEGRDEFGGADRHDVYQADELLRQLPIVDPHRISLFGFSRGGMMALLAAIERPGFQSVIFWNGVCDLFLTYEERVDLRRMLRRVVGHPQKNREAYLIRSPVFHIDGIACPVLIIHGVRDENVSVEHAYRLSRALTQHRKPHDVWLVEEATHLFDSVQIEKYTRQMFAWLAEQPQVPPRDQCRD
ncbi:prolyl oligopeptidase family serine peptidase [Brevibacillus humidisoli]|uniref:alpha/beta hydrolase family protein n=1 Tax=Brevibacillus humidisoli TaxID=2895522 RepID=UPI001E3C547B|nr:prolyl oligopeptidase family serine peptidase [Brevibacillus humidisoli]UFJ43358.1 prolyl oligopeptidase family serine peptidase [Brevibacillus humidisoli]